MTTNNAFTNNSSSMTRRETTASKDASDAASVTPTNMSTLALENKLRRLRQDSQTHSQILTQKLASSQSGQNLLHIGTSLSTLPPDLHLLLSQLHPFLSAAEVCETEHLAALTQVVKDAQHVRVLERRAHQAQAAAELVSDMASAEASVTTALQQLLLLRHNNHNNMNSDNSAYRQQQILRDAILARSASDASLQQEQEEDETEDAASEELDQVASLERAAHITLCLVQELHVATETVSALTAGTAVPGDAVAANANAATSSSSDAAATSTATGSTTSSSSSSLLPTMRRLEPDSEKAQFVLQLAPRIRRLESNAIKCLAQQLEVVLRRLQQLHEDEVEENNSDNDNQRSKDGDNDNTQQQQNQEKQQQQDDLLFMLGHCMRGLVLLGRGNEAESVFARVAVMPLVRAKVSMGRLDEGGARGECAGLVSLLDELAVGIRAAFGPVLQLSEAMFSSSRKSGGNSKGTTNQQQAQQKLKMDVDLMTAGVWVPIATALMADAGIKMAIFSPGIASILQANYVALDRFLAELAERLLKQDDNKETVSVNPTTRNNNDKPLLDASDLYFRPCISAKRIQEAQDRIYAHAMTAEFSKKWNLPIYYQLRFGECCSRLNRAVDATKKDGWTVQVFTGSPDEAERIKHDVGFELSLFLELYDVLLGLWRPDVILRPLTNRFLRGAVQLIGRILAFVTDGMEGTIKFGEETPPKDMNGAVVNGDEGAGGDGGGMPHPAIRSYCWGESEQDVAAVAWELTILDSTVRHDYVDTVCKALETATTSESEEKEIRNLVSEMLKEISDQIHPLIDKAWNEYVVKILTSKCSEPLAAVKGVAATYRMTNRPPPTQASPFVGTILRPLKEFGKEFENRTPDRVGARWKQQVVVTVSDLYAAAVEELIATVQRTELALNSRRARRTAASGGLRDGEKVKLQLYLDYEMFAETVRDVGVDPASVIGLSKLRELTAEGSGLVQRNVNGS